MSPRMGVGCSSTTRPVTTPTLLVEPQGGGVPLPQITCLSRATNDVFGLFAPLRQQGLQLGVGGRADIADRCSAAIQVAVHVPAQPLARGGVLPIAQDV